MGSRKNILFTFIFLVCYGYAYSQIDTVNYHIQSQFAFSDHGFLPVWIVSNRYGVLKDDTDVLLSMGFEVPYSKGEKLDVSFGLDLIGKPDINDSFLQQGYLKIKYGVLELRGGRIEETTSTHHEALSSGSLAQSKNARHIPKIAITVPEYAPVPFTQGYLEFKGYFGHGWLGKDRVIENSYLHEKNLYINAGGDLPVNFYIGFIHYAIWAGSHPVKGPLPSRLQDFVRVIRGAGADKDFGPNALLGGEINNVLGNHLGIYDFGLTVNLKQYNILLYNQVPFEDGSGMKPLANRDRFLGLSLQNKHEKKSFRHII